MVKSIFNDILVECARKGLSVIGSVFAYFTDETPHRLREKRCGTRRRTSTESSTSTAVMFSGNNNSPTGKQEPRNSLFKIIQSDAKMIIIAKDIASKVYKLLQFDVPLPLQHVDRTTGRNLKRVMAFLIQTFTSLDVFRMKADADAFHSDIFTMDRASANDTCLDGYTADGKKFDLGTMRLPCFAHAADTVQGRAYASIAGDITGIIAMSLDMQASGSATSLRDDIVAFLKANLDVHDMAPVPPWDPKRVKRDAMLSVLIPLDSDAAKARLTQLKRLLPVDLESDRLHMNVVGGLAAFNVEEWADETAEALFPKAIPPFPRTRWLQSLSELNEYALLGNCNKVLFRVVNPWLRSRAAKDTDVGVSRTNGWKLDLESDDEGPGRERLPLDDAGVGDVDPHIQFRSEAPAGPVEHKHHDPNAAWAQFNKDNRTKAIASAKDMVDGKYIRRPGLAGGSG